jgi:hypothetical protein
MNSIPSADAPANQNQISMGGQQLIIVPSLSDDDIAVMEEQENNEERQQGQGLVSKQTSILENAEEKIKNTEKYNFNNNNGIPLELPFP